ncbi:MAG: hypothetical protein FJX76_19405 [Armatimonadetes bacterium]|nr:hypothetical protein [Armatimonadota bacterium]
MEVQVGGAQIREEVGHYRENARKRGWRWVRRGEWFDAWMRPVLLEGPATPPENLEKRIKVGQSRIASAATGELENQDTDTIEDAVSLNGDDMEIPEVFHRAAGRAIFVAREHVRLIRDCLLAFEHVPREEDVPAAWELMASVMGVTPEEFIEADEDDLPDAPLPASRFADFGIKVPSLELAHRVGARVIRHAVWQTAVPGVGRAVWAGWNDLAARQVAQMGVALAQGVADMNALLLQARRDFATASRLIVLGMWSMATSDASLHHSDLETIDKLCVALDIPGDWMKRLRSRSDVAEDEFLNELERVTQHEARQLVHDAVVSAALADGRLEGAEMEYLKRISERLGQPFDEQIMRTRLAALQGHRAS